MVDFNIIPSESANVNVIEFKCPYCGKTHKVELNDKDFNTYVACRAVRKPITTTHLINLDVVLREKLISGLCEDCQEKMFSAF